MRFGLVAGEASGDLLGAGLVEALKERVPGAIFEGVTGPRMLNAGVHPLGDAERLAVMGYAEPLKRLPELLGLRRSLIAHWTANPPDALIGIDAPDFNLALERALRARGTPTAHYVSPSVWAWRQGRVRKIRAAADVVLCVLPFEKAFYDQHQVDAVFVGHPTADLTPVEPDILGARGELGLGAGDEVLAVLPGSRMSEVSRLAPVFAEACSMIQKRREGIRFVTPVASPLLKAPIEAALSDAGILKSFKLLDGNSEVVMTSADVILLASGTAALEAALLQKPIVAAYKVSPMTAAIIRAFDMLKVDSVTLPNQLTEKPLIPEFIQNAATPEAIAGSVDELFDDPDRRRAIASRFAKLREELALGASQRAAEAVLALVDHASTHTA